MKTSLFWLSMLFLISCQHRESVNQEKTDSSIVAPDTVSQDHTATGEQPGNYNGTATDSMHMDTSGK